LVAFLTWTDLYYNLHDGLGFGIYEWHLTDNPPLFKAEFVILKDSIPLSKSLVFKIVNNGRCP